MRRVDLAVDELDLGGYDGVFHLAGQPGVRSFGDVFPLYVRRNVLATQRVFEAAARGRRPRRLGLVVVGLRRRRAYPTPEDAEPRPRSPYGITKLACEQLARAYGATSASTRSTLRYFTVYGPRQRPDMFFTRVVTALAEGGSFELYGDGQPVAQLHLRRRRGRGDDRCDGARRAGASTTSAAARRRACSEAIALLERLAGRTLDLRQGRRAPGDLAPHEGRHDPDPRRPRLGAGDGARGRSARPVGVGARLESRRDEPSRVAAPPNSTEQEVDFGRYGARSLARWWLPLAGLVARAVLGDLLALGGGSISRRRR